MSTEKVRICHVQCLPMVAGAQRTMLQIFDVLDRDRYEPSVICQGHGPLAKELADRNIPLHYAPSLVRPIHPVRDWKVVGELEKLFRKIRPEIVHTHSSKPGIVGRRAAYRVGVPHIVHHVQGFAFHEFSPWPKAFLFQRMEAMAARWSSRIIFVSQEERDASIARKWVTEENSVWIPNVVDRSTRAQMCESDRKKMRRELGLQPNEVGILIIGRVDHQKQPEIIAPLARALKAVGCRNPWKIIVAGDGPRMTQLERDVQSQRVQDCVSLLGWIEKPHRLYQCADVVLLPSLWEGLPLVLLEAFGAGRPIVASRIKGNRELVTPDVGYLCEPRNPSSYAIPLKNLIDSVELREKMGQAGLDHAPDYDLQQVMPRVEKLYDELTGRGAYQSDSAHGEAISLGN